MKLEMWTESLDFHEARRSPPPHLFPTAMGLCRAQVGGLLECSSAGSVCFTEVLLNWFLYLLLSCYQKSGRWTG